MRNSTGESAGQDANPDGRVGVVAFSILDGWEIIVVDVFLFCSFRVSKASASELGEVKWGK